MIENYEVLCVSRILLGMSAGYYSVICPLYSNKKIIMIGFVVREISPKEWSGKLTSMHQFNVCFGIFVTSILGLAQPDNTTDSAHSSMWRLQLIFPILPAIINILLLLLYYKTETPKYILSRNNPEEVPISYIYIYIYSYIGSESSGIYLY